MLPRSTHATVLLLTAWLAAAVALVVPTVPAVGPSPMSCRRTATLRMGFFDSIASAFENDDTLGEAGPAGLKKKAETHKIVFEGPQPTKMFEKQTVIETQGIAGQKLKVIADAAGVPIRYSCMEGTCGVCDILVDGERVPACTAVCPKRDITIDYAPPRRSRKTKGSVKPTKKAGFELPTNPFATAAAAAKKVPPAEEEGEYKERESVSTASLEDRLRQEMVGKKVEKKGGWPFG